MSADTQNSEILVVGSIRGLLSEVDKIGNMFRTFKPDAVALSISKEQLEAMIEHQKTRTDNAVMENIEEEFYVKALERFGEVKKPPPGFVKAWELCDESKVPLYPIDFDDEEFTDIFCGYVSGFEWLRQPARQRRLERQRFTSTTPEEFVLEWDSIVNRTKGMRKIETAREKKLYREAKNLSGKHNRVMLVVDYERSDEVSRLLKNDGCQLASIEKEPSTKS